MKQIVQYETDIKKCSRFSHGNVFINNFQGGETAITIRFRLLDAFHKIELLQRAAITSISTSTCLGSSRTATAERAGKWRSEYRCIHLIHRHEICHIGKEGSTF